MILKALKYTSYLILIFGFFYMSYHWGVMKGKEYEQLHGEDVVLMSDCSESPLFTSCKHTYINSEKIAKLYEEVRDLLKEPSTPGVASNIKDIHTSSSKTATPDLKGNKKLVMK